MSPLSGSGSPFNDTTNEPGYSGQAGLFWLVEYQSSMAWSRASRQELGEPVAALRDAGFHVAFHERRRRSRSSLSLRNIIEASR
jgi:hypothetical protein